MSLTFYSAPMSTASITEAVLAELSVPHTRVQIDIGSGETRREDFLALNPNGRVPVIVHDGTSIWESAAITMYLGELFGVERGLYPALGPRRGEAMKWIVWCNVNLAEAGGRLAAALPPGSTGGVEAGSQDWQADEMRRPEALQQALADIEAHLSVLNGALSDRDYLLGKYSLADTHLHGFVGWLSSMEVDLSRTAHVAAWLQRCRARPERAS